MIHFAIAVAFALTAVPTAAAEGPLDAARIKEHVRILSDDSFEGRGPTQGGEVKTIAYLVEQFRAAGLEPGNPDGSWVQDVRLIRYDRQGRVSARIDLGGQSIPLEAGRDVTAASQIVGRTALDRSPLIFVGYGIDDPALGWDNYGDADLSGKVAVFLANDPDFEAEAPGDFGGRTLVFAGRFGAKVAAARAKGAAGVLVIHETEAASYPWSQVGNGDGAPGFALTPPPGAEPFGLTGWLHRDVAADLFRRAGMDFDAMKARARNPDFKPVAIGDAALTASFETAAKPVVTRNVVARLKGASRPHETLIYGAHWDANGVGAPDASGDGIRNGAVDNAIGTATLIEVARAFAAAPRTARSLLFIAYTAEEKGLLGAEYYAANPLYPLETTVAVLNHDPHVAAPRTRSLDLIGGGRTPLEADLERVAAAQGLSVEPEANPEAGWYFRSDHFAFAKRGVPTVAFRAGRDFVEGGREAGAAHAADYNARHYHQPSDEFDPTWTLEGAAQEGDVAYALGRELAEGAMWPGWNEGVEYKSVRDASAAVRR